jgi:hypothetical protein
VGLAPASKRHVETGRSMPVLWLHRLRSLNYIRAGPSAHPSLLWFEADFLDSFSAR